jgi:hypothetical protein
VLSESSYLTAIYWYTGASSIVLIYMAWWLNRHWSAAAVALTVLVLAALMLTPAYPSPEVNTFAPALIVIVFETLINGPEAAQHALKPLGVMLCIALVLALLLRLLIFRPSRTGPNQQNGKE